MPASINANFYLVLANTVPFHLQALSVHHWEERSKYPPRVHAISWRWPFQQFEAAPRKAKRAKYLKTIDPVFLNNSFSKQTCFKMCKIAMLVKFSLQHHVALYHLTSQGNLTFVSWLLLAIQSAALPEAFCLFLRCFRCFLTCHVVINSWRSQMQKMKSQTSHCFGSFLTKTLKFQCPPHSVCYINHESWGW